MYEPARKIETSSNMLYSSEVKIGAPGRYSDIDRQATAASDSGLAAHDQYTETKSIWIQLR